MLTRGSFSNAPHERSQAQHRRFTAVVELSAIVALCFLYAGWPPPDVNEAHYLAKAKNYWNPQWCAGDHFLESADAHVVFYWTFGWLTLFAPLPAVAWIGRLLTWSLLAWSWRRLSRAVVPVPWLSIFTAALFITLTQHGHMAGEWVVGGVEAKGFAFVLVFLALERMLHQHWNMAWLLLGAACAFHVLVGGWSLIAGGCAWLACGRLRPPLRSMAWSIAGAILLAMPGLLPALALNGGVAAATAREANEIYVYGRLSHHLVFHRFSHWFMARQALLLIVWLAACFATPCPLAQGRLGQRPLRGFVGGAVAIAVIGIVIDQSTLYRPHLAASLLRFYWYRLSDVMLPLGVALSGSYYLWNLRGARPRLATSLLTMAALAVAFNFAFFNLQRQRDPRPGADRQMLPTSPNDRRITREIYADWKAACGWIKANTAADAMVLTPRSQQTFKWYAERGEVCSWKDVPQDAAALVHWWHLQQELYPRTVVARGLPAHGTEKLVALARKYKADYVVVDRTRGFQPLDVPRVFPPHPASPFRFFEVYKVPKPADDERANNEPAPDDPASELSAADEPN